MSGGGVLEQDCATLVRKNAVRITLGSGHKPQAVVDWNTCDKEGEAHQDAEKESQGGRERANLCICVL